MQTAPWKVAMTHAPTAARRASELPHLRESYA
jgi:hypothetical protein